MRIVKVITTIVTFFAVVIGLLLSPIPSNLGVYRWLAATVHPGFVGLNRAFVVEDKWAYTFDDLYENNNDKKRLSGQTAIVTGANSGVGYAKALILGRLGASVTLACRNVDKCNVAAQSIRDDPNYGGGEIRTMTVDTSSLKSVRNFCMEYIQKHKDAPLDMLFLNAGVAAIKNNNDDDGSSPVLSEDGIEKVFATNFVGHHLMYRLLEPLLLKSKVARIVQTSSASSFDIFHPHKVATSLEQLNNIKNIPRNIGKIYGQSKLAQILWVKQLTSLLSTTNNNTIYANAYHPGAVDTGIWGKNPFIPKFVQDYVITWMRHNFMWTAEEGALTGLYLGIEIDELRKHNIRGKFYHPQTHEVINEHALDVTLQKKIWSFANELVSDFL